MPDTLPPDRAPLVAEFLNRLGRGGAAITLLAGDASFRKYYRVATPDHGVEVLMDAPPPQEDIRPFVRIARFLAGHGFSAPRILGEDDGAGLLLIEDLGDDTYTRLLAKGEPPEEDLYALAVDALAALHKVAPPADVPRYDLDKLLTEAALLTDWFMPAVGLEPDFTARAAYLAAWRDALQEAFADPQDLVLVLRDYHVDNLLLLPEREGIAACGLLDFQDAVIGPAAYDVVSLVEDARRDIDAGMAERMVERYLSAFPHVDAASFRTAFTVLGAQRHAKVIGIFTRLCVRDGKPQYLRHIPRVWGLLHRALDREPALAPVRAWLDTHLPPEKRIAPACP
ncbi:aminoglycoside phosphotransferase family protein [Caenispirillum salinarum]|uniref:aminoglycoside phosphotransferase family protein n=1 Tax=Caenispirillum salinarum TaxID=859058 RepID=UPI00385033EF